MHGRVTSVRGDAHFTVVLQGGPRECDTFGVLFKRIAVYVSVSADCGFYQSDEQADNSKSR